MLRLRCLCAGLILVGFPSAQAATPETNTAPAPRPIPYVPSRHDTVRDLLWLAGVGTNDVVYDLGSGDGRVVIAAVRDFGARRGVGIEVNPQLVQESREKAAQAGVANRVAAIHGDLFTNDISPASVVVLYLGHGANLDLRARLIGTLRPGARVVSHQFGMGEWAADKTLDVRTVLLGMYSEMFNEFKTNPDVPDYDNTGSRASHDVLSAWSVPAPVAGVWRGPVRLESGEGELRFSLHQRLSQVTGSFQLEGPTNLSGHVQADLWGDHLRCWFIATNQNWYHSQMWFEGQVSGDALQGGLWTALGQETRQYQWTGRRHRPDFTGTWEWSGPSNSPVQLKLERRAGQLAATYVDSHRTAPLWAGGNNPIPVIDLYDFGGGFYFTVLLGLQGTRLGGSSRMTGPENGWLIGEAIVEEGTLTGSIAFYPYRDRTGPGGFLATQASAEKPVPGSGRRPWQPKRISP